MALTPFYHYTSQDGLIGILEDRSIRATSIRYLNDSTEFQYTVDLVNSFTKMYLSSGNNDSTKKLLMKKINEWSKEDNGHFCHTISFSEEPDQLSQWRAYSNNESGFNIMLYESTIDQLCSINKNFVFGQCLYDRQAQFDLILGWIYEVENEHMDRIRHTDEYVDKCFQSFLTHFYSKTPFFKDPSFIEEKEWRIVTTENNESDLCFRKGKSMVIPYKDFPIVHNNENLAMDGITIGPCPHMELSKKSTELMLLNKKSKGFEVALSKVPFRTW